MKADFFCADDGVVTSTDSGWLQSTFDFLMRMFDRVGLRTNFCKTVGVLFWPFRAARVRADKSYTQRMIGEGRSFKEQQQERVLFP